MPIPARSIATGDDQDPVVIYPVPERWQRTYVSIRGRNGEGEEIPLTGLRSGSWPAMVLQPGATGLDMPPYAVHMDESPNLDGATVRGARATARPVMLPIFIYGIDRKTLREFKAKLANALNPRLGYSVLTFIEQDGETRRLKCYYAGGMEGSEAVGSSGFTWISYGIQLTAADPFFYGDTATAANWSFGLDQPLLSSSFLPVTLAKGVASTGTLTVENPGDIEAWPVWEITGPLKRFKFTGPDGTSFGISDQPGGADVIATGRTLTVDCRPGFKTVADDTGQIYFPLLSASPSLWSVPPGTSTAQADLLAGSGRPTVKMTLYPRYLTY
ncbi:phage tail domain-containing protein [Streptomyces sp. NPDC001822]|uniref:phage tail domain-containing protein n=1 Tax=Streptomyces sp. NPDC001822 TaxID=3364614 RepID=UPI0036D04753